MPPTRKAAKKRTSPRRRKDDANNKDYVYDDDDEQLLNDDDNNNNNNIRADNKTPEPPTKRQRRKTPLRSCVAAAAAASKTNDSLDDDDDDDDASSKDDKDDDNVINNNKLSCPHCDRTFTAKYGLDYHVKHFVCRPELRPTTTKIAVTNKRQRRGRGKRKKKKDDRDDDDDHDDDNDEASAASPPKKKFKRFRGKAADRTCPHCKRVFTSVLGYTYHKENRVCLIKERANKPFYSLNPGECYVVASLGGIVVEVLEDSRATPTADPPNKQVTRRWYNAKLRRDQQSAIITASATVKSLTRRRRLGMLYQQQQAQQQSSSSSLLPAQQKPAMTEQQQVFDIYFGTDPRRIHSHAAKPVAAAAATDDIGPDPSAPPDSFPDRIVVCKAIPDKRKFFYMHYGEDMNALEKSTTSNRDVMTNFRLYLRRSDLKEEYNESDEVYVCMSCGAKFSSKPGCQYHVKSKVCQTTRQKAKEMAEGRLESVDRRMQKLLLQQTAPKAATTTMTTTTTTTKVTLLSKMSTKAKARAERSIYPQVLIGMGYKLLPISEKSVTISAFRPKGAPRSFNRTSNKAGALPALDDEEYKEQEAWQQEDGVDGKVSAVRKIKPTKKPAPITTVDEDLVVSPDVTLRELRWQLQLEQSQLLDPVYPGVFKALKFVKPKPKPKLKQKKKDKVKKVNKKSKHKIEQKKRPGEEDEVEKIKKAPPPVPSEPPSVSRPQQGMPPILIRTQPLPTNLVPKMPDQPLPQIVDVSVLMAEIDGGRYPSIQRWTGARQSKCSICKEGEKERKKLLYCTICPQAFHWDCIRTRYTMKDPEPVDDLMCQSCIGIILSRRARAEKRRLEKQENPEIMSLEEIQKAEMDEMELSTNVIEGREHECCAAVARQVNDLTDLLRDAQLRLSNNLELSRINAIRRQMIASHETEALF